MTASGSKTTNFSDFAGLDGRPSTLERRLIDACFVGGHGEGRDIASASDVIVSDSDQSGTPAFKNSEVIVSANLIAALANGTFEHTDWPNWTIHTNGLNLAGAIIDKKLILEKQQFLTGIVFEDCYFLEGCSLKEATISGQLVFDSCWVQGQLNLCDADIQGSASVTNCSLFKENGIALLAKDLQARKLDISNSRCEGAVDISGSEIIGRIDARNLFIDAPKLLAFNATGISAKHLSMTSASIFGKIDLNSSRILGNFNAQGITVKAPTKRAINAFLCYFGGAVYLRRKASVEGSIDFSGSTIERDLDLSDAQFTGNTKFSIRLDGVVINGKCTLENSTVKGLIYAAGLRITDRLSFKNSELTANSVTENSCQTVAEDLSRNSVDALLAKLHPVALSLKDARINGRLVLSENLASGIIDLSHAHCSVLEDSSSSWPPAFIDSRNIDSERMFYFNNEIKTDAQHLVLDGFTYDYFEYPDGEALKEEFSTSKDIAAARVRWLSSQSVEDLSGRFNPQPWRQAANVLRNMGHDRASQIVTIQRRVRERYAKDTPWKQKLVNHVLHLISDYGYNPWKTIAYCIFTILLFASIHWGAVNLCGDPKTSFNEGRCSAQAYTPVRYGDVNTENFKSLYPEFDPLSYSLGTFVPLFDLGSEPYWRPNTSASIMAYRQNSLEIPAGWILYWLFVFERILGGVLIAIAITGFTGVLSREDK